jgi:hypothetical protein
MKSNSWKGEEDMSRPDKRNSISSAFSIFRKGMDSTDLHVNQMEAEWHYMHIFEICLFSSFLGIFNLCKKRKKSAEVTQTSVIKIEKVFHKEMETRWIGKVSSLSLLSSICQVISSCLFEFPWKEKKGSFPSSSNCPTVHSTSYRWEMCGRNFLTIDDDSRTQSTCSLSVSRPSPSREDY